MWHVYVLELENGCYYIGIAEDVDKRFTEHQIGLGANFTRRNRAIRVVETQCCESEDKKVAQKLEDEKTLQYACKYGGNKVKGGRYFFPKKLTRKVERLKAELLAPKTEKV